MIAILIEKLVSITTKQQTGEAYSAKVFVGDKDILLKRLKRICKIPKQIGAYGFPVQLPGCKLHVFSSRKTILPQKVIHLQLEPKPSEGQL